MDLSESLVKSLIESNNPFPVDFDQAWDWIGYSRKDAAKKKLTNNFIEGVDFSIEWRKTPGSGRPSEFISLTIDCFKSLAMMAGTGKGREVREHFLSCERSLKSAIETIDAQTQELEKLRLQLELAKTQERLLSGVQTLEAIAPGLGQLAMGRQDVEVERIVTVEQHVIVNDRGQIVHEHSGQSPTTVAKTLGMKAAKDLKAWLESIGRSDLIDSAKTIIDCQHIRTDNIKEIRRLWSAKKGNRQKLLGEG